MAAATQQKTTSEQRRAVKATKEVKVQARMEPDLKHDAEKIFGYLGVSPTQAIRMFYTQVKIHRGFPFEVKVPNDVTLAAMKEAENPEGLETIDDDKFFDNL